MKNSIFQSAPKTPGSKTAGIAIALSIGLALSGCGSMPTNRTLYSVNQPVVERTNYTFDVSTGAGGLSYPEQRRLAGWFEAMDLRYGDRISIDDPLTSSATRAAVETLASRHGLLLSETAPTTPGYVNAGMARIVLTRSSASVPNCPNWDAKSDVNLGNATSTNFGCATNGNLAAMIANPEDLVRGADATGNTIIMSSTKAIKTYRDKAATGADDLKASGSKED
ncbi:MAG: CpaD family pilus assembly protein [Sphingomonadaceae bacterium]|nr:CpaD family pilus assembly protein [Sphingomonadaceae bacterium]